MLPLRPSYVVCGFCAGLPILIVAGLTLTEPRLHGGTSPRGADEWVGVLHVHTVASDGGGTVEDVLAAARSRDLDFVLLTDHNVWGAPDWAYRDSVLLIVGEEVNTPHGHLVVAGGGPVGDRRAEASAAGETPAEPEPVPGSSESDGPTTPADPEATPTSGPLSEVSRDRSAARTSPSVGADEGLRIVAHPTGKRPWTGWDGDEFDGIEIWNADTERRGDRPADWLWAVGLLPLRPMAALYRLLDFPVAELALWDRLLQDGPVFGVCAVDAHHTLPLDRNRSFDLHFPSYRHSFAMAQQHVLVRSDPTGEPAHDGHLVLAALGRGSSYCAFDGLADAGGARFTVRSGTGHGTLGDSVPWAEDARLEVTVPRTAEQGLTTQVRVIRDGGTLDRYDPAHRTETALPGPGVYRVEVVVDRGRRRLPWILTNPIWLTPPSASPRLVGPGR